MPSGDMAAAIRGAGPIFPSAALSFAPVALQQHTNSALPDDKIFTGGGISHSVVRP